MLKSATGQISCRHVAALRKILPSQVPKGVGEDMPAETENSSEQELPSGNINN